MTMITSPTPTESEIAVLNAILPGHVKIRLESGMVLMEFRAPEPGESVPLFAYEITPAPGGDFAGPGLAELLEDLAATVTNLIRGTGEAADEHPLQRILLIVNGATESVHRRRVAGGRFRVLTHAIYSTNEDDWSL